MPPDFSRWRKLGRPLLETLSMSIAGTVLGAAAALVLGALSARTVVRAGWLREPVRVFLNILRSIPGLIWGVIFVAAVGFGPLPGILALGSHSTGVLGKFFAEILEHADPAPSDALLSHGVSRLGVLRYSVLPQILPRLVDATVYRWEHNLRAATTLGVVGAGGPRAGDHHRVPPVRIPRGVGADYRAGGARHGPQRGRRLCPGTVPRATNRSHGSRRSAFKRSDRRKTVIADSANPCRR